jgi:phospholipid transport system transporter-binding protein
MSNFCGASDERSFSIPGGAVTCVQDGSGVWHLGGELDVAAIPELRDRLNRVEEGDVTLDCSALTFLDSSGLALLVALYHARRARGAELVIVNPSRCVTRVLELTGLSILLAVPSTRSAS